MSNMNAAGFYGYRVLDRGGAQVVVGQSTTRDCRRYVSAPRPKAAAN